MKIDMSPEAVANRLKLVNELRKVCLSLANSSAGREINRNSPIRRSRIICPVLNLQCRTERRSADCEATKLLRDFNL